MAVVDLGQVVFKFSDLTPEEKAELKGATGIRYGVCSTSGSNKSKNVNISSFSLEVGAGVNINFLNANTGTEPTLNISSTGAYPIVVGTDSIEPDMIEANHIYTFVFDGTYWQMTSGAGAKNPVVLTQEEFNELTTEQQNKGEYYITDVDVDGNATTMSYDNNKSGLEANSVQGAIDEIEGKIGDIDGITDSLTANSSTIALSAKAGSDLQTQINTMNSNLLQKASFKEYTTETVANGTELGLNGDYIADSGTVRAHLVYIAAGNPFYRTSALILASSPYVVHQVDQLTSNGDVTCYSKNGALYVLNNSGYDIKFTVRAIAF